MYKERPKCQAHFLMTSLVSRKKLFSQREKKVPKIKSVLFEKSLNTINNWRNNNILYKIESQHLVRCNTADSWECSQIILLCMPSTDIKYLKYRNKSRMTL